MKNNNKTQRSQLNNPQAAPSEWPCSADGLQCAEGSLYTIDLVTGDFKLLGPIIPETPLYNAIGFSMLDNTLWGYDQTRKAVVKINPDLSTEAHHIDNLGDEPFYAGDIDKDGHLYIMDGEQHFYVVDVNSNSPTYLKLVDPRNGFQLTTDPVPLSHPMRLADWSFSPIDNQLYTAAYPNTNHLNKIDPLTGNITQIPITPSIPYSDFGATFFGPDGALYGTGSSDPNGGVYRITFDDTSATWVEFTQTDLNVPHSTDGARCASAPLNLLTVATGKSVDLLTACPGDILTYTVQVKNPGKVLPATNSIFQDIIPTGTTFVPNSVKVNGVQTPGNPNDGVPIGDIAPGQTVTVIFQVKVEPNAPNPIRNIASVSADNAAKVDSNEVTTKVPQATLNVIKEADVGAVQCSGHITYTLSITNEGPDDLNQIEVLDPMDPKTSFVPNSVKVDGVPKTGANPTTGMTISPFPAHTTKVIQFQVQVAPNTSGWIYNKTQAISCGTNTFTSNQTRVKICPCNVE
ncbi:DUF11 domain-containing protein [Bacillus sp. CDB3]|uniref:DUF11 domain-containing protein n=1 Tax=Bacillus sp. CDB3 TaxID=360310 RepID=UPI0009D839CA|nr:DUF11 domain-containing protein [Bacillus sp. CDB3]OQR53429.1 hypothetical protein CDB3_29860 [Bacillus sp. CDB3]